MEYVDIPNGDCSDGDLDCSIKANLLADTLYEEGLQLYTSGYFELAEQKRQEALRISNCWTDTELPPYAENLKIKGD